MTRYLSGAAAAALLIAFAAPATAQSPAPPQAPAPVRYDLSFDNAVYHEARITATWRDVPAGPLRIQMSRSSPGRYAIHEFAKNVYSVSAVDGAGRSLRIDRTDPYGWTVEGHDGAVVVTYTLFGDRADGTYAQIDAAHAHLNMPATLMWATGFDARPVEVRFQPRTDWTVATQLKPSGDGVTFTAPNLQYLMDSPTELSDHALREWTVDDHGTARTIRLTVHHDGSDADVDTFAEKAKKVVAQHIAVWGDVPDFDFGTYTFLADYMPQDSGDGMEHRNSTVIIEPRSLRAAEFGQLDTLSHEFFHAWNVERLRPAELEPFDFTDANPTPSLWFAEGFTQYYGPLAIRRAGESTTDEFLRGLGGTLSGVVNSPARGYGGPQEMSLRAPFVDAATSIDPTNPNIFVSYYPYGAVIALALDLTLRGEFDLTLDDYMRQMWKTHGVTERPYRPEDLRNGLAELTGDRAFAERFFQASVEGSALPDFAPLLARAGLVLRPRAAAAPYVGRSSVQVTDATVRLAGPPQPGSPLYLAGLEAGDEVVSLGGVAVDTEAGWRGALAAHAVGDEVEIVFNQRGAERRAMLKMAADPALEIARVETIGGALTGAQRAFREAWLGQE
jgi:predicted metalloprotease with PDZ domain